MEFRSGTNDLAARYEAFVSYLISQYAAGKQTILIVDEAQNLSIELLEELRLLSNINADEDQLLQMILVGQPELLEKLRRPELVQFAQRISVSYHLAPLGYFETRGYIKHRLTVAQADPDLFSEAAIKAVFHFTKGVPRLINSICDMACVYGYADGLSKLDTDIVLAVIQDKKQSGLLPLYNLGGRLDRQELEVLNRGLGERLMRRTGKLRFRPAAASEEDRQSAASVDRMAAPAMARGRWQQGTRSIVSARTRPIRQPGSMLRRRPALLCRSPVNAEGRRNDRGT